MEVSWVLQGGAAVVSKPLVASQENASGAIDGSPTAASRPSSVGWNTSTSLNALKSRSSATANRVAATRAAFAKLSRKGSQTALQRGGATFASRLELRTQATDPACNGAWLLLMPSGDGVVGAMQLALMATRSAALCTQCRHRVVSPWLSAPDGKANWTLHRSLCRSCASPARGIDGPRAIPERAPLDTAQVRATVDPRSEPACTILQYHSTMCSLTATLVSHAAPERITTLELNALLKVTTPALASVVNLRRLIVRISPREPIAARTFLKLPTFAQLEAVEFSHLCLSASVWGALCRLPALTSLAFDSIMATDVYPGCFDASLLCGIPELRSLRLIDCSWVLPDVSVLLRESTTLTVFERHSRRFDNHASPQDIQAMRRRGGMWPLTAVRRAESEIALHRAGMTTLKLDLWLFGRPVTLDEMTSCGTVTDLDLTGLFLRRAVPLTTKASTTTTTTLGGRVIGLPPALQVSWAHFVSLRRLTLNGCRTTRGRTGYHRVEANFVDWEELSRLPHLEHIGLRSDGKEDFPLAIGLCHFMFECCFPSLTSMDLSGRALPLAEARALLLMAPRLRRLWVKNPGLQGQLSAASGGVGANLEYLNDESALESY